MQRQRPRPNKDVIVNPHHAASEGLVQAKPMRGRRRWLFLSGRLDRLVHIGLGVVRDKLFEEVRIALEIISVKSKGLVTL